MTARAALLTPHIASGPNEGRVTVTTPPPQPTVPSAPAVDPVNLFVNYIPLTVKDAELLARFSPFGRVLSAKIMRHLPDEGSKQATGLAATHADIDGAPQLKSKGYGFVLMGSREEAAQAIKELHGAPWETKRLAVQVAQRLPADVTNSAAAAIDQQPPSAPTAPPLGSGKPVAKSTRTRQTATIHPQPVAPYRHHHHLEDQPQGPATVYVGGLSAGRSLAAVSSVLEEYGRIAAAATLDGGVVELTFASPSSARQAVRWMHGARVPQLNPYGPVVVSFEPPAMLPPAVAAAATFRAAKRGAAGGRVSRRSELVVDHMTSDFSFSSFHAPDQYVDPSASPSAYHSPMPAHMPSPPVNPFTQPRQALQQHPMPPLGPSPAAPQPAQLRLSPLGTTASCGSSDAHGPLCGCGTTHSPAVPLQPLEQRPLPPPPPASAKAPAAPKPSVSPVASALSAAMGRMHHDPYHPIPRPAAAAAAPPVAAVVEAPQPSAVAAPECVYCDLGTTVILQNMPFEDCQCEQVLNELLGPIGYFRYWECWGNGIAVATFPDRQCAAAAVELLHHTPQRADYYDCQSGGPLSAVARRY